MECILRDFEAYKYITDQYETELQLEVQHYIQESELKTKSLQESRSKYLKLQTLAATQIYRLDKHNSLLQTTVTHLTHDNEKLRSEVEQLRLTLETLIIHRETSTPSRVNKVRRIRRDERASKRRRLC